MTMGGSKIGILFLILLSAFYGATCAILKPCQAQDQKCILDLLQEVKHQIADGIPELGIPRLDPMELGETQVVLPDIIELNVIKGILRGPANCYYDYSWFDIVSRNGTLSVNCDISVTATYNGIFKKPIFIGIPIKEPLYANGTIHGVSDKTHLNFDFQYSVVKSADGVIRLSYEDGVVTYDTNYKGHRLNFNFTGIYHGDKDISDIVNKALNKNWKLVSATIINTFIQNMVSSFIRPELTYILKTPASTFLSDDLEPYLDRVETPDDFPKCSVVNTECQLELIKNIKSRISKGVPDMSIPNMESLYLKNLDFVLPDLMDFTLLEGILKGADKCVLGSVRFDLPARKFSIKEHCDMSLKGKYTALFHASATMSVFGGKPVAANGNTLLTLLKLPINTEYQIKVIKKSNGDTHIRFLDPKTDYVVEPGHNITFNMDGIFLGEMNISEIAMDILNQNWEYFAPDFAPIFVDEANNLINGPMTRYLSNFPTKQYLTESLDKFVDIMES